MLRALKLSSFRDKLHALRRGLDDHAAQLREEATHSANGESAESFSTAPVDSADRAGQQTEVAVSIGLAENEARLRAEIDAALDRVGDGSYGICEECRAVISARRLQAVPYARYCVRCERRFEEAAAR
jgi:DnaK suppressor protein